MTAIMDAVAAATAAVPRLYRMGSVPASPTYPYGVFAAAIGSGDGYTLDAGHGLRNGGVVLQTFGKTVDSALTLMSDLLDDLLDVRLPGCTPMLAGLPTPALNRDPDDNGVVTATMPLTFAQEA